MQHPKANQKVGEPEGGWQQIGSDAAKFLRTFQVNAEQLQELMDQMRDPDSDPEIIARRWIESNSDVVSRRLEKGDR